jgi:formamidopyrimidine-DNA glycosylase
MPELPDVEHYKRYLTATALHQPIARVQVVAPALLTGITPQALGRMLKGKRFESARRHGKYLFIALDNGHWLALHFGMTGSLHYFRQPADAPAYSQCLFHFDNGFTLAYVDPRKLGRIALTDDPQTLIRKHQLGADALALSAGKFIDLAAGQRGQVKAWLMQQNLMAGIGNIYSDEILFQAGIHPRQIIGKLDEASLKRLYRALRAVLKTAIDAQADPEQMPASYLLPRRHAKGRCPKCGTPLERLQAAGRTAWFCPRHQPG